MAPSLHRNILTVLSRDDLRRLADRIALRVSDRRARAPLEDALREAMEPDALLDLLTAEQLRAACAASSLPTTGRRADLVARLQAEGRNGAVRVVPHSASPASSEAMPGGALRASPRRAPRASSQAAPAAPPERLDFTAIDFETAAYGRDSACSVALVKVRGGVVVEERVQLLRPPSREFVFTSIHGLTWEDVRDAPTFGEAWPGLSRLVEGSGFLAAHNASFDRSVLRACAERAGLPMVETPFRCTVKLARERWDLYPTKLPDVCEHLGIPLDHHEALSDARACARIVVEAAKERPTAL